MEHDMYLLLSSIAQDIAALREMTEIDFKARHPSKK